MNPECHALADRPVGVLDPYGTRLEVPATVTYEPDDDAVPYKREPVIARIHNSLGANYVDYSGSLFIDDKRYEITKVKKRPHLSWATVWAVHLAAEARANAEGTAAHLMRPVHYAGPLAHMEEKVEVENTPVVIHKANWSLSDVSEGVVQETNEVVIYMARVVAERVKPRWAVLVGNRRFRVERVKDLGRIGYLPGLLCTETGQP